ncbi:MAG: hypothetical protein IKQ20_09450 [Bacteroidales bacterium]|nr:hypothetical protein [Bacteroidales bacterium]
MSTETGDVTVTVTEMRVSLSLAGTYFLTAQQNGHTTAAPCAACETNCLTIVKSSFSGSHCSPFTAH